MLDLNYIELNFKFIFFYFFVFIVVLIVVYVLFLYKIYIIIIDFYFFCDLFVCYLLVFLERGLVLILWSDSILFWYMMGVNFIVWNV